MVIPLFGGRLYGPRMAIDAAGKVFLTAESPAGGMLHSFNPDLTLRWSDSVSDVNLGGPALGRDGGAAGLRSGGPRLRRSLTGGFVSAPAARSFSSTCLSPTRSSAARVASAFVEASLELFRPRV